jgi:hypothetical protein
MRACNGLFLRMTCTHASSSFRVTGRGYKVEVSNFKVRTHVGVGDFAIGDGWRPSRVAGLIEEGGMKIRCEFLKQMRSPLQALSAKVQVIYTGRYLV